MLLCLLREVYKPLSISYPDGSSEKFFYTLNGELEESIGRDGTRVKYTYDPLGREICTDWLDASGKIIIKTSSKTYNAFHLLSELDPTGTTTTYQYDHAGLLTAKTVGNRKTTYQYDACNRQTEERQELADGSWIAINKLFDQRGRLIAEEKNDSFGVKLERWEYTYEDSYNKHLTETSFNKDGEKSTTSYAYDGFGRVIKITDPLGEETHITYGQLWEDGRLFATEETVDPRGTKTVKKCDALSRVIEEQCFDLMGALVSKMQIS